MSGTALGSMASELSDHWRWRADWAVDRPYLLWYLTFEDETELAQWAGRAQDRLRQVRTLNLVPPPWLHLTLGDVGFVDEVSPDQVEGVITAARTALAGWTGMSITLGPVTTMVDAVVLGTSEQRELEQLRRRLQQATASAVGLGAPDGLPEFWPHVTLAYVNDLCDRRTVLQPLKSMASDLITVTVSNVTLAAVTRVDRHYQWTAREAIGPSAQ
jgi:2'-5' RNA ligase